jgi:hypothetical protein
MPVARTCFYCRKTFLKSTYEMFSHVQSCSKYEEFVKRQNKNNTNDHKIPINDKVKCEHSVSQNF